MNTNSKENNGFLQVSGPSNDENKELDSGSNNLVSSNATSLNDECTALVNENKHEFSNNDINAQIKSKIALFPWQTKQMTRSIENATSYGCLGISPNQFRALMSSKKNQENNSSDEAVRFAQIAIEYALQPTSLFEDHITPMSIIVLIVDDIQKYNIAVFNKKSLTTGTALRNAREEGNRLVDVFQQARQQLSPELAGRVTIIRWQDIDNEEYKKYVKALEQYLEQNEEFERLVDNVVDVFTKVRRPNDDISEQQRLILRQYVLNELPALVRGITYGDHHCPIIFHPIISSNDPNDVKNDHQRKIMLHLLNYIRQSLELLTILNINNDTTVCEVYDIAMLRL